MQFSAVEIRFIVTTYLYSTFANDLKRKYFFRKMFIVTEYAALIYLKISHKFAYSTCISEFYIVRIAGVLNIA